MLNLFAELKVEPGYQLATQVFRHLWPERVDQVRRIEFEHSPGRGDSNFTGNRSAFDVYVEHTTTDGGMGFIGIEVKYHENLQVNAVANRKRLQEVADEAGIFPAEHLDELRNPPLQQLWFDHLLALSMLQADDGWTTGLFVLLHPVANTACYRVGHRYQQALLSATFQRMTLDEFIAAVRLYSSAHWIDAFRHRYLEYERADITEPKTG